MQNHHYSTRRKVAREHGGLRKIKQSEGGPQAREGKEPREPDLRPTRSMANMPTTVLSAFTAKQGRRTVRFTVQARRNDVLQNGCTMG